MIIDAHVHLHCRPDFADMEQKAEELLECFRLPGISKSVLMKSGARYETRADMTAQAEALVNVDKKYPDKFLPLIYTNCVLDPDFLITLTEKYVLHGPLAGIKMTIYMNYRDPRLERFFAFLETSNIPVLLHAWYKTTHKCLFESDPADICHVANRHPNLRILMAHLTGCRLRGIQDIKRHANIRIDTSGSQPEDGFLAYALDELGPDRILYGSDYPGRDIATQLGRIASIGLSAGDRDKILYKNALNFFGK